MFLQPMSASFKGLVLAVDKLGHTYITINTHTLALIMWPSEATCLTTRTFFLPWVSTTNLCKYEC